MEQSIRVQVPAWAPPSLAAQRLSPPGARLAQWLERLVYTEDVAGSSPAPPTTLDADHVCPAGPLRRLRSPAGCAGRSIAGFDRTSGRPGRVKPFETAPALVPVACLLD